MKDNIKKIVKLIIIKLDNIDKWGGSHTELRNIKKGLPISLMTKNAQKDVEKALKFLVNNRFLLAKKSTYEVHVSLNPKKAKEIHEFLHS